MSKHAASSTDRDMDSRIKRLTGRVRIASGKFFSIDACRSRCAAGLPLCGAFAGSTRPSAGYLPDRGCNRELAGAATARVASCDFHERALCVRAAEIGQFFFLYFQHQLDARREAFQARGSGSALAIGPRHFRAERDEPFPIPLDNGGELTSQANLARDLLHNRSLTCWFLSGKPSRRLAFRK